MLIISRLFEQHIVYRVYFPIMIIPHSLGYFSVLGSLSVLFSCGIRSLKLAPEICALNSEMVLVGLCRPSDG